ncbi:MAG: phosphoenolpyruvate--protein phosphotransferase, partial [Actinomycetota bacterium]|nr:phosphoenolpyruvate--protein phosphotransferase [Actinomycetota bacterium]
MKLTGIGASEGVAVGPVFVHAAPVAEPERRRIAEDEVEAELARFGEAVEAVAGKLAGTGERLRAAGSEEEAGIFEAHVELAQDPELASGVEERVRKLESPEAAVLAVGEEYAAELAAIDDEYLAARADDVRDVAGQISAELTGQGSAALETLATPSVILARSLDPSDTARIRREMALGLVTAEGSRTSHVSIMARSMGIPAVVGVGPALEEALDATTLAVDGTRGYAVTDPDGATVAEFERRSRALAEERAGLDEYRHLEARTRDGRRIEVAANLGSASDAEGALGWGAEGVGLFRTEFLFMERDELPSEEEQYEAYRAVAKVFGGKPVIVRTLDVGGDKDLPGVDQPPEENPFLGWRGIRMSLDTPDLFEPQLRAILRAASHGNLKVMFPMVVEVGELRAAKELLEGCRARLKREGTEVGPVEVG